VDEDDFDLGGFDEAYSPDDFSQADMDFATAVGMQTAGAGSDDDSAAQFIANQFAQPQAGMNRSNIIGTANFDPQFAAAFDISRGLDPTNNFGGVGGLSVPSYLRPQTPGNLVLNEAGDRMMYGSPVERFAQETAPEFVRGIQKVGIGGLLNTISEAFSDAKRAIGLDGGAQGGLKVEDLQPTMGTLDPSDRFLGDMSQQGADIRVTDPVVSAPASVNMASVPQVSPMFDQFGNPYRSGFDRNMAEMAQQSLSGGIASVAPTMAREANTNVVDATRSLQGPPAFIDRDVQRVPGGFQMRGTFDYPGTDRDTRLESTLVGTGKMRPTEQDAMDAFLDRMYTRSQTPIEKQADASQFLNPQVISRGLNYFAGPQIQDFFRGVTNNPNTTIRLGPGLDMDKQEIDDNIFSINIPFATG
jgi:hypothetical protein